MLKGLAKGLHERHETGVSQCMYQKLQFQIHQLGGLKGSILILVTLVTTILEKVFGLEVVVVHMYVFVNMSFYVHFQE